MWEPYQKGSEMYVYIFLIFYNMAAGLTLIVNKSMDLKENLGHISSKNDIQ